MCQDTKQPLLPGFTDSGQCAVHLAQSLSSLRLGLCRNQIRQTFNLGKIEFAVVERTTGKFPCFGRAQAVNPGQSRHNTSNNGTAAMNMQLDNIFTGKASWRWKPEHERTIDLDTFFKPFPRIAQRQQTRTARNWYFPGQGLNRSSGTRARNSENRNACYSRCG
jgi:hypothetical protein